MYSATLSNPWSMGLLMLLLGMLVGYAVGRRVGHREGVAFGLAFAPIDLRREAWQEGECAICGTRSVHEPEQSTAVDTHNNPSESP